MGSPSPASIESTQEVMLVLTSVLYLGLVTGQEFQKEANPPLNCPRKEQAKTGDRVLIRYEGRLANGDTFDKGEADFVIGENKVIAGWEQGFSGQCAGENIVTIVPPTLGYGLEGSDKVPANSTLYFLTSLDGIVRVTKPPVGGDCNEGVKARPNQDVTMRIKARVSQSDGRGKIFFDKPSFELRFGKPNAKTLVVGIEKTVTGTCVDEKRLLLLGPALAYGSTGNKNGSVPPNSSVSVEVEVTRVRNKQPESDIGLGFLHDLANGKARLPGGK